MLLQSETCVVGMAVHSKSAKRAGGRHHLSLSALKNSSRHVPVPGREAAHIHAQLLVRPSTPSYSSDNRTRASRGLKYVSRHRTERVTAIARYLADTDYDVVALQELWVFSDYEHVRDAVSSTLPHSKFFYRYVLCALRRCGRK